MDSKRGIGKNNDLLFRIPQDFERVKKLTLGHSIIMGRRTFESIGRVLPGRYNIVITRDLGFKIKDLRPGENGEIVNSLEEAIEVAKKSPGNDEIFIFGGGQIFKEAMEKGLVDRLYLTIVEARLDSPPESPARRGDFGADTFFPDYSMFKEISREDREDGKFKYKFVELEK